MNQIFLFDIDGTLTPPRQPMEQNFASCFLQWASQNIVYLVTGSDIDKVKEQVSEEIRHACDGVFCCSANQLYCKDELIYTNEFEPSVPLLLDLGHFLDLSSYNIRTGNHIERRPGVINFSIVGRNANLKQRKQYHNYDEECGERHKIVDFINSEYEELEASIGGQISVDVYRRGCNKSQAITWLNANHKNFYVIFFGDQINPVGNDYPIVEKLLVDESNDAIICDIIDYRETAKILFGNDFKSTLE